MSEIKVTVDVSAMRKQIGDQMLALILAFGRRSNALAPRPGTPVDVVFRDAEIQRIVNEYCKKISLIERITPGAPPYRGEYDGKNAEELLKMIVVQTIAFSEIEDKQLSGRWILSVWHAVLPAFKKQMIEEGYMQPEAGS